MQENQNPQSATKTTAVAPITVLKSVLDAPSVQAQFKNALGEHKDTFVASLIDLFTGDKSLQTCKPAQLIQEALRAATLKLPLNKALGFAYIVVYNNSAKDDHGNWIKIPTPTFILGYKGYIQMAMRTGQYRTINADIVYEGEMRKGNKLTGEILLDGEKKSDKVVGYFCYFELLNGFSKTLFVSVEEMASYAKKFSPSIKKTTTVEQLQKLANTTVQAKSVGWEGNFNDMALKTTVRRLLSKYGYLSVEMQSALSTEQEESSRADLINDNANKEVIATNVEYEEVDEETGEIKNPSQDEDDAPADEEPNY